MRHWQVAAVTLFNLLSPSKLLFQDYFIHLPFTHSSKFQCVSTFQSIIFFSSEAFTKNIFKDSLQYLFFTSTFCSEKLFNCSLYPFLPANHRGPGQMNECKRINLRKQFQSMIQMKTTIPFSYYVSSHLEEFLSLFYELEVSNKYKLSCRMHLAGFI